MLGGNLPAYTIPDLFPGGGKNMQDTFGISRQYCLVAAAGVSNYQNPKHSNIPFFLLQKVAKGTLTDSSQHPL